MELLLGAGAPVDGPACAGQAAGNRSSADWGPLHLLLGRGDESEVKQLLQWRADTCRRGGPDEMNPLMLAISFGHNGVAAQLLAAIPDLPRHVDEQDLRGRSALHFAVMTPATPVVKRLQVEEAVRLVMQRSKCRAHNKYEESEM